MTDEQACIYVEEDNFAHVDTCLLTIIQTKRNARIMDNHRFSQTKFKFEACVYSLMFV